MPRLTPGPPDRRLHEETQGEAAADPRPVNRHGHADVRGARHHGPRRARTQPQERRPDDPEGQARRLHGALRVRQIVAGVRYDLCRGPAPLRRVAVGLCASVPRDDVEARRRPDRRPVAGHLDRAKDHLEEPALDGRHGHGNLRLHAAVVRAGRHPLFARDRPADREPDGQPDGRSRRRPARAHPPLPAGADDPWPQGRVSQGDRRLHEARLPAPEDRWRILRDRRGARPRQES